MNPVPKKNPTLNVYVLLALVLGIFIGMELAPTQIIEKPTIIYRNAENQIEGENIAVMGLPAVNLQDGGVAAALTVKVRPGNGNIFVNIDNVLANFDTQQSARVAARVAAEHEAMSLESVDIIYDLMANASMLEGPSAGAAMTLTTIAAMKGQQLRKDVMITGTINHDGTIGPAGRVDAKAVAAASVGSDIFLVPVGESEIVTYEESEHCQTFGVFEYCEAEFVPNKISVGDEAGIDVIEVADIDEALEYLL